MIGFDDKKYPAVSIQGVVLATNLLAIQADPKLETFISIGIVLLLFTMQAINSRLFYYFPRNSFVNNTTYHIDTIILYFLTFMAIYFMLAGLFKYIPPSIAAVLICGAPFLWHFTGKKWVKNSLVKKFRDKTIEIFGVCQCCGGKLQIIRKLIDASHGTQRTKCLGECRRETKEQLVSINLG